MNAPLTINGDQGTNTITTIGSIDGDYFVLTANKLEGGGLNMNIDFNSIDKVTLDGDRGDDHLAILSSRDGIAYTVYGGSGSDTIEVAGVGQAFDLQAVVGLNVEIYDDATNDLASIAGPLIINGDEHTDLEINLSNPVLYLGEDNESSPDSNGGNPEENNTPTDTLNLYNSSSPRSDKGRLTEMRLSGFGLSKEQTIANIQYDSGLPYHNLEMLHVEFGNQSDVLDIINTHTGFTEVITGDGQDQVNVIRIQGATTLTDTGGSDTYNVGSTAPLLGGTLANIDQWLVINGQGNDDTLNIDHTQSVADEVAILTESMLTGLHLEKGIEYHGLKSLNIGLGAGSDVLNVQGTSANTTIELNDGDEQIFVSSDANLGLNPEIDFLAGHLDNVKGPLNIIAGLGTHRVMISDEAAAIGDSNIVITDQPIPDVLPADIAITGMAPAAITISVALEGDLAGGMTYWLGSGNDTVAIDVAAKHDGMRTVTTLNTGLGDDLVSVDLENESDGFFVLNTQGKDLLTDGMTDNDTVDASTSTLPLIIFGGQGDDQIIGGLNDNIIVGDRGQVRLFNGDQPTALFGGGGPGDFTTTLFHDRSIIRTIDPNLGGDDTISGSDGNDIILGGFGDDTISGSNGQNILLGDNGWVDFQATLTAATTDPTLGGNDMISSGDDSDVIFGGSANDIIDGGAGSDILLGDHGRYDGSKPIHQSFVSIDYNETDGGGNDTIHGGPGDDFILGQQGDDLIYGDAGEDDILGGHHLAEGADGDDTIHGGDDADVILGDNGLITRSLIVGTNQWLRHPVPFADVVRQVTQFHDQPYGYGSDIINGDAGDDILHGQRGDDSLDGGTGDDEIYGGLGDDTLNGNAGNDVLIANLGTIIRSVDQDGQVKLDRNGSWHRDVLLEDSGTLTGILNISSTISLDQQILLADQIQSADLIVLAGAYDDQGIKKMAQTGAWDTVALFIDLAEVNHSTLNGGPGDDILFGHRGNDTLHGADGNDIIFGDGALNIVPFDTDIPHIYNSLRLVDAVQTANVNLIEGGSVILNPMTLLPDDLNDTTPFVFLSSVGTILPEVIKDFVDQNNIGPLVRTDGVNLVPFVSVVPGMIGHTDVLPGNDIISGGGGDDMLFGDTGLFYTELTSEIDALQDGRNTIWNAIHGLLDGLHALAIDHDTLAHNRLSLDDAHDIFAGNDTINGNAGRDMIFGDNGLIVVSFVTATPQNAVRFMDQAQQTQNYLFDLQRIITDFDFTVFQAQHEVLAALIEDAKENNPNRKKLKKSDLKDPNHHDLIINNDTIFGGMGDDLIVGDDGTVLMPVLDTGGSFDEQPSEVLTQSLLRQSQINLKANAVAHNDALKEHVKTHFDTDDWVFKQKDLKFLVYDHEFDKETNNNVIDGQEGADLILGNFGVFGIPVIPAAAQNTDAKTLRNDVDKLLKSISRFVNDKYEQQFRKGYESLHHTKFINRGGNKDKIVLIAANDLITGGDGDDFILGDSAAVTASYQSADPEVPFDNAKSKFLVRNLNVNLQARHSGIKFYKKLSKIENDRIEGGGGSTVLFGQWGRDNLFGGSDDNVIYGGSGKDKIDNAGGTSRSGGGNVPNSNLQQVLSDHLFGTIEPLRRVLLGLPADQGPEQNNVIFDLLTGNRLTLDQLGSPIATSVSQDSFLLSTEQGSDTYTSLLTSQEVFAYLEMNLTVTLNRGPRGTLRNSYVIFDYQSDTDYKFVGINSKTNKLEIGRYTSEGWIVDAKVRMNIKANKEYDLRLILNQDTVSLVVNNKKAISHTFDSILNNGELGLGTHQATAEFKNFEIQRYKLD